jgi:hypothetical protein
VTIIDLEKRVRLGDIQVGVEPEGMAISPDGKFLINTSGICRDPIRLLSSRCLRAEIDVHWTVGVLLQVWVLRGSAQPRGVSDNSMGRPVIRLRSTSTASPAHSQAR